MKRKGFTLIELLVVIAILAVILLIAVPIIIGNIDKSKVKSYENQVALFKEGAKRLALEYNKDLIWKDTEVEGVQETTVTLRELAEKDYVDLPVTNPKTGEEFDPDTTLITIRKNKDGSYDFEYEDQDSTGFKLIVGTKAQTITRSMIYDRKMIMADVYGRNDNGEDITSKVIYTCKYNQDDIDCNTLSSTTKETGTYYITYSLTNNNKTKTDTRTVKVLETSRPIIEVRPEDDGVTKVSSVRVTIIYPEGSKSRIYGTKNEKNKTYVMSFDINENQTITADCIDKNGLKCEQATKDIRNIKIVPPTITVNYSPTSPIKGYYKQGEARVVFREKAVKGEEYYIKTTKVGTSSIGVTKSCGTGETPSRSCTTIPETTTLNENTWYKVSEKVNVTYNQTSTRAGSIKAIIWSSTIFGEIVEKNIEKIDVSGPTVSISGNPNNWTTSAILTITSNDNESGLHEQPYSFDGGITWTSNNTSKTYTTNGAIKIKVKDKLGNITSKEENITKLDATSPTATIVASKQKTGTLVASNTWVNEKLAITLTNKTVGESGGTIYYCIDTTNTCDPSLTAKSGTKINLNDTGIFYVRYKITSGAGKISTISSYTGKVDIEAPMITNTIAKTEINKGSTYNRYLEGITVEDNVDKNLTATYICKNGILQVINCNTIPNKAGVYYIIYDAKDSLNNKYSTSGKAEVKRQIVVKDVSAPVITLRGESTIRIEVGSTFSEPGYTAIDDEDGDITSSVQTSSNLNTRVLGTYTIQYLVRDKAGNQGVATRTINVVDTTKPTIEKVEGNTDSWTTSKTITVTASDNYRLHELAYSFDNGVTWQSGNSKKFTSNGTINIKVRDTSGNIRDAYPPVNINKIDTSVPTVGAISGNPTNWVTSATLKSTITDSQSGVSAYAWTTSNTAPTSTSTSWTKVTNTTSYTFSKTITTNGTYYLWAKDETGRISANKSVVVNKIDTTIPTINLNSVPTTIIQGDSYALPTGYTVNNNLSGGSAVCKDGSTKVTNTSSLSVGSHTINCTVTTGANKTATASKTITVTNKVYKIGDKVTLKDNTTWYVIEDSDANKNTVTLFAASNINNTATGWTTVKDEYKIAFDEAYARSTEKNPYCVDPAFGCGMYAANGTTVTEDSTVKKFVDSKVLPYINNSLKSNCGTNISSIRLLTHVEYLNLKSKINMHSTNYWTMTLSNVGPTYAVRIHSNGSSLSVSAKIDSLYGVRPVIVTSKSNVK